MYTKKIKRLSSIVFLLLFLLTGCGINPQPEAKEENFDQKEKQTSGDTGSSQGNVGSAGSYYTLEELYLPDPDKEIKSLLGEEMYVSEDPVLCGDSIYRSVIVIDENGNYKDRYVQILKLSDMKWNNISAAEEFEIKGEKYSHFGKLFFSDSGQIYSFVQHAEEKTYYLGRFVGADIIEILCTVPAELSKDERSYSAKLVSDGNGSFYYFHEGDNNLTVFDEALKVQKTVTLPGEIADIVYENQDGCAYWYGKNADGKVIIGNLCDDEIFLQEFEGVGAYEYKAEFSSLGSLFLADKKSVWKVGEEPQQILNFIKNDYIVKDIYGMEAGKNGEIQFLVSLDGEYTLLKLKGSDNPPETQKQEIVIAFAMEHLALNKIIARFNRQSEKYHISVMLPEADEDWTEFRDRIQLEMSVGRGPDILGHDIVLNIEPFVENDYLECLDGLLMDETEYLQAAIDGCRIDGKLYGVPYDCTFNFIAYSEVYTEGRTSWTMPELMSAVRKSGVSTLQKGYTGEDIVMRYALYDNSNTAYIDWEKGESHLTDNAFIELLAFAKEYADTGKMQAEKGELVQLGEAFAVDISMDELHWLNFVYACFQGKPSIIGYPKVDGNGIYLSSRELYVNNNSAYKEGAKAFLKYLVSEEVQTKYIEFNLYDEFTSMGVLLGYKSNFPVNLKAYEVLLDTARDTSKTEAAYMNYGVSYKDTPYTDEQVEQFYFLLENAQPNNFMAAGISGIVSEELAPYFSGDITAVEAAEKLDNRVQLYLNERVN